MSSPCHGTTRLTHIVEVQLQQEQQSSLNCSEKSCDLPKPLLDDDWNQLSADAKERLLLDFEAQLSSEHKNQPLDLLNLPDDALKALIKRKPSHLVQVVSLMAMPLQSEHQQLLKALCDVFEQTFSESEPLQDDYFTAIKTLSKVNGICLADCFVLSMDSLQRWHHHIPDIVNSIFLESLALQVDASQPQIELRNKGLQKLLFFPNLSQQQKKGLWLQLKLCPIPLISHQDTQTFYHENWMALSGIAKAFDAQRATDYYSAFELLDETFSDNDEIAQSYYVQLLEMLLRKIDQHLDFTEYVYCSGDEPNFDRDEELKQCMEICFHIMKKLYPKPLKLSSEHQALLQKLGRSPLCQKWHISVPFYCYEDGVKVGKNLIPTFSSRYLSHYFIDYQRSSLTEPLKTAHTVGAVHSFQSARRQLMVTCLRMPIPKLTKLMKNETFSYSELCLLATRLSEVKKQVFEIAQRSEAAHQVLADTCAEHTELAEFYHKTFANRSVAWRAKVAVKHPRLMKQMWKEFEQVRENFSALTQEQQQDWKLALVFLCDSKEHAHSVLPFAMAQENTEFLLCQLLKLEPSLISEPIVKRVFSLTDEQEKTFLLMQYGYKLTEFGITDEQIKEICTWEALSLHPELSHRLSHPQILPAAKYNRTVAKELIDIVTPKERMILRRKLRHWPDLFEEYTADEGEKASTLNSLEAGQQLLASPEQWESVSPQQLYELASKKNNFARLLLLKPQYVPLAQKLSEGQVTQILVKCKMWGQYEKVIKNVFNKGIDTEIAKKAWLSSVNLMIEGIESGYITSEDIIKHIAQLKLTERQLTPLFKCSVFMDTLSLQSLYHAALSYESFAIYLLNSSVGRRELTVGQLLILSQKYYLIAQGLVESVEKYQFIGLSGEQWLSIAKEHPILFQQIGRLMVRKLIPRPTQAQLQEVALSNPRLAVEIHRVMGKTVEYTEKKQEPKHPVLRPDSLSGLDFVPLNQFTMVQEDPSLDKDGVCAGLNIEFARYALSHDEPLKLLFKLTSYDKGSSSLPDRVNHFQRRHFDYYEAPLSYERGIVPSALSGIASHAQGVIIAGSETANTALKVDMHKLFKSLRRHKALSVTDASHACTLVYLPKKTAYKVAENELPGDLYFFDSSLGGWHWQNFDWKTQQVELMSKINLSLPNPNAAKKWCICFSPINVSKANMTHKKFKKANK